MATKKAAKKGAKKSAKKSRRVQRRNDALRRTLEFALDAVENAHPDTLLLPDIDNLIEALNLAIPALERNPGPGQDIISGGGTGGG